MLARNGESVVIKGFKNSRVMMYRFIFTGLVCLIGSVQGESLTRTYGSSGESSSTVQPTTEVTTVTTEEHHITYFEDPLDPLHRDAITDALMPVMGMPGQVNYAINCFISAQGNTPLFIISKFAKDEGINFFVDPRLRRKQKSLSRVKNTLW